MNEQITELMEIQCKIAEKRIKILVISPHNLIRFSANARAETSWMQIYGIDRNPMENGRETN